MDLSDDAAAFRLWRATFVQRCAAAGWVEQARVPDLVAAAIASGQVTLPAQLLVAGFDEFTPQQQDILARVAGAGCHVETLDGDAVRFDPGTATAVRVALADPDREIEAAARWARAWIEKEPGARIGVIVTDLGDRTDVVQRWFADVFDPGGVLPGGVPSGAVNVASPRSLSDVPVVRDALDALAFLVHGARLADAGRLLRSPFFAGGDSELTRRALLDAELRRRGRTEVTADTLAGLADREDAEERPRGYACPVLAAALRSALGVARRASGKRLPSEWADSAGRALAALGWPGERGLDSTEYQAVDAWRDLLPTLAGFDAVLGRVPFDEAVRRLRRCADARRFQPEGQDAAVTVLGVLEAGGLLFDHVWIAGMDDERWPRPAHPNPFLPIELQRRHGVPHASPEREQAFAQRLTGRLLRSAPDLVVSHARREKDRALRPSPLVADLPEVDETALPHHDVSPFGELVRAAGRTESRLDDTAPALRADEAATGGVKIFQHQAACPFRAFAELRLGARPLEPVEPGLSVRLRGVLVHRVLQETWDRLQNSRALAETKGAALEALVADAVDAAMAASARDLPDVPPRVLAIERARLARLALAWLEVERTRTEPFEVVAREEPQHLELAGITCEVRVDRVDRLGDGTHVLVDYKTGQPKIGGWSGERPDEPQLPLYCAVGHRDIVGLAFAKIRAGDMGFKGIADRDGLAPGVEAVQEDKVRRALGLPEDVGSLSAVIAGWRTVLEKLGEDFRLGRAAVDPKDPRRTCENCPQGLLCRVGERGPVAADESAAGGDDRE